jgi:regulator of RNase E activity RraA
MTEQLLDRLRRLDCCTVSDALDRLSLTGVVSGFPRRSGQGVLAGRATTMLLDVGDAIPGPVRHLGCLAIEASGPDEVIVVQQRAQIEAGCWGGLLTLAAKTKGVAGVIADGHVRDIDEAAALDFPIYSRGVTALTARGRIVEKAVNAPVEIGGRRIEPGDFAIADASAVIFVSAGDIGRVLEAAEAIAAREQQMAAALRDGATPSAVMGAAYEHLLKR